MKLVDTAGIAANDILDATTNAKNILQLSRNGFKKRIMFGMLNVKKQKYVRSKLIPFGRLRRKEMIDSKTLCAWCDAPLNKKNKVIYEGEYICRGCYLNHLIKEELENVFYVHTAPSPAERVENSSDISRYSEPRTVIDRCSVCDHPIYSDQLYFQNGSRYLHEKKCAIKHVALWYLSEQGWILK